MLLLMHMDKLVAMLDTHMRGTDKWKSVVGPKIEEKLMSNITRSTPITVMPYLGGTFKVFTGDVYLVVDMQQHKCTCLTWKMSGLPCAHVCAVIRTLRHDVYDYIDPCFKVSTQHLIYSGQFQLLPTHNMPKVCEDETLQDGQGNVFPSLQPPRTAVEVPSVTSSVINFYLKLCSMFLTLVDVLVVLAIYQLEFMVSNSSSFI
ncbi:hypothetical protein CK203_053907 [Vitis vinifera]|uniref:SWIM-type domain-containing protein n=1 Tax=Vitis vinifera TaxID=29760 RepID=A0A438GSI8_VITVI|nr:hypothetical protein CK203_053907 [Vitis vinifera]